MFIPSITTSCFEYVFISTYIPPCLPTGLSTPTDSHALKLGTSHNGHSSGLSTIAAQPRIPLLDRERKLALLRRALDGDYGDELTTGAKKEQGSAVAKEQLVEEFTKLCVSDENQFRQLMAAKQSAEQVCCKSFIFID